MRLLSFKMVNRILLTLSYDCQFNLAYRYQKLTFRIEPSIVAENHLNLSSTYSLIL